jgi:ribosomal protein S18 acetylase RimI-like enzyme
MRVPSSADPVQIRPATLDDAGGIASAHVRAWKTAYRGILPDSFLDALEPASRIDRWRESLGPSAGGRLTYVAESPAGDGAANREIVGFVTGGPERDGIRAGDVTYDGEIYGLYLIAEYRRQGTGHRLVAVATQALVDRGMKSVVIWVLKDNTPARAFYEGLGGVQTGEKTVTIGASNLLDVAYGWPDARELLSAAQGATT